MTSKLPRCDMSVDSGKRFDALLAKNPALFHSVDADGNFLHVSDCWAGTLGRTAEEMRGKPILDFLTSESRSYAQTITIPAFRRDGRADSIGYNFVRKDGSIVPVVTSAIAEYRENGEFLRSFAISFESARSTLRGHDDRQMLNPIQTLLDEEPCKLNQLLSRLTQSLNARDGPNLVQLDVDDVVRTKKILVVEDDPTARCILVRQLKDEDVQVYEAGTGDRALDAVRGGLTPDLLLTDVVMPGQIQGPELAKRAREVLPDLRVLFMSGYPVDISPHAVDVDPEDRQLLKPISKKNLITAVTDLLVEV